LAPFQPIALVPCLEYFSIFVRKPKKYRIMGKGDKRSKRGKIRIGSFGVSRKRKKARKAAGAAAPKKAAAKKTAKKGGKKSE
jgi:30S ribosomal protein S31